MPELRYATDAVELPDVPEEADVQEPPLLSPDALQRSDDALAERGVIDANEVELDRDFNPGDSLFKYGDGKENRFEGTVTGSSNAKVVIYDIRGYPHVMTRDLAMMRLQKRYGPRAEQHAGQRVFYRRPPVQPPVATVPCPSKRAPHRKKFNSLDQAMIHFRMKHGEEWREQEREGELARQERLIAAQERQVELMAQIVASGGNASSLVVESETEDESGDAVHRPRPRKER